MENLVSFSRLEEFYKDKKVLITGHTGFKGAWLMACLHLAGAEIKGYALPPEYETGLFSLLSPLPGVQSILADIRDKDRLRKEMLEFNPDIIFHLAAQPLVRRSYEIPADTFDINVTGTANLLEIVRDLPGACAVIVVTTDKVYENKENGQAYQEGDQLGGHDPYSASKACTELVVSSFRNSFFGLGQAASGRKSIASARAGNVIGGGDWSQDRIVPDIVRFLRQQRPIEVRNPSSVRPWQHVLEPLAGYLQLGMELYKDPQRYSKAYNFGPLPGDHLSVQDLVETSIAAWGEGIWVDRSDKAAPHEAGLLHLDISLAKNELSWRPRLPAKEAIHWTLDWYRQEADKVVFFTMEQIKSYFAI